MWQNLKEERGSLVCVKKIQYGTFKINLLGENVAALFQTPEIYAKCKDLNEVISREEICTALKPQVDVIRR